MLIFLFGISLIDNPSPIKTPFGYLKGGDVSSIKWELGIAFMILGVTFAYAQYKKKPTPKYTICPKCKETYHYYKLKNGLCPTCNIETIDIEEYYNDKDEI